MGGSAQTHSRQTHIPDLILLRRNIAYFNYFNSLQRLMLVCLELACNLASRTIEILAQRACYFICSALSTQMRCD